MTSTTPSLAKDPRPPYGQTVVHERVTFLDGTRFLLPREEARDLIRDGLARPERSYVPSPPQPEVGVDKPTL